MNHRHRTNGTPVTGVGVEAMAGEAGRCYALDELPHRRKCRRPAPGSAAASVESVRLDPELKRALLVRAAAKRVSVSAVIRRAIGACLRAG